MFFPTARTCLFSRTFALVTLVAFAAMWTMPPSALSQTEGDNQTEEVFEEFQEVSMLRADGDYQSAIGKLHEIIEKYANSDDVLKTAYHHLVWTYQSQGDTVRARESARDALVRFPDLTADEKFFPADVNGYYNELRVEMFGSLAVVEPEGCRVFLDGSHVGETPLTLPLVPVGEHELTLTKSGYQDYTEFIEIQPDSKLEKTVPLERKRGVMWWTYRVGAGVIAVGLLALGLSGGDEPGPEPEPEPLPGPPDPPGPPTN